MKYIICTNKDTTKIKDIEVEDEVLKKVRNFKHLGVTINEKYKPGAVIVDRLHAGKELKGDFTCLWEVVISKERQTEQYLEYTEQQ